MWNWIKFTVLTLLMIFTAALSYTTWIDLVFPPSVASWSEKDDELLLIRASEPNTASRATFSAVFTSKASEGTTAPPTSIRFTSGDYSQSTFTQHPYIATSGRMTDALRACSPSTETYTSDHAPQEVPISSLPKVVQDAVPHPLQAANNFAVFDGQNIGCTLPAQLFWTQRGSRHTLSLPVTTTITTRPEENNSPSWGSAGEPSRNPDITKSNCVMAEVTYGAGTTLDAAYPQPNLDGQTSWGAGLPVPTWAACTDSALGVPGTDGVDEPSINVSLTDVVEKDGEARSLFFAGAAAAILSALFIELTKAGVDLLEARAKRNGASVKYGGGSRAEDVPPPTDDPPPSVS
jgi:hypothetical protein